MGSARSDLVAASPSGRNGGRAPRHLDELAVLGGTAAFAEPLHVGRPNIGDRAQLHERIDGALDRRWLANDGPLVAEFERRVAELMDVEYCVATASATAGLQLVARALDLTGEVVMPSFTFVGTAHALAWLGIAPVFADIDVGTHNLDPAAVERMLSPRTSAIVGVHLWGRPCDVDALEEIANRHNLALVFDAAHALGCTHQGKPLGSSGRAEVFSFHATKVASAGEGGVVTTNDPELARRVRLMRNFGFTGYDRVTGLGTNAKMNELSAALGLTSLDALDRFVAVNRRNHQRYERELRDVPGVSLVQHSPPEHHNYHYVVVEVEEPALREDLVAVLHAEDVLVRRYFAPGCHRLEPYLAEATRLPVSEALCARVLALPTGTSITEDDIATICAIIRLSVARADELHRLLQERV
jgi:dTDP-4-amino-4,6-dideoxygalactose transaminase